MQSRNIFDDAEAAAHGRETCLALGPWSLHLPQRLGFCGGVRRALHLLDDTLQANPDRAVWLLGEIIHNDTVNRYFQDKGAHILPEDDVGAVLQTAQPHDILVIPAFGLPRPMEERVRTFCRTPGCIVDTTCAYVRRIWSYVEKVAARGCTILLHGKPEHPETRATLSRALTPANAVALIPDRDAAERLCATLRAGALREYDRNLFHHPAQATHRDITIVNQTTMLCQETREIETLVAAAAAAGGGNLTRIRTLCRATQERQEAALTVCRRPCDLVLVAGGFRSSNTTQLYRLAREHGRAYFIGNATALHPDRIEHYDPARDRLVVTENWLPPQVREIGLLAGASCPPGDIGDVIRALRRLAAARAS